MTETICPFCHFLLTENFYFCPNCGKKIKEEEITPLKQLSVYALSLFLPPLGLWPGIKYLRQNDPKTKKTGLIAIILTLISTVITIWLTINFVGNINSILYNQINPYQELGL